MPKLRSLAFPVAYANTRIVKLSPRLLDPAYSSPEFKAWRTQVIAHAGYQCEAIDHGQRCPKAKPEHRLFADHIIELRDGGELLDLNNGQCLCGEHHTLKTMAARAQRHQRPPDDGCK
jgi:hypothetical protein